MGQLAELTGAMLSQRQSACLAACHVFERKAKWYASGHGGGPHPRSGNLKNSIQSRATAADEAQVAPSMDYAAFVEYGTSRMPAYPYMRPAYEAGKEEAARILSARLEAVVSLRGALTGQMGTTAEAYNSPLPEE